MIPVTQVPDTLDRTPPLTHRVLVITKEIKLRQVIEHFYSDEDVTSAALEQVQLAVRFYQRGKVHVAHRILSRIDEWLEIDSYPEEDSDE